MNIEYFQQMIAAGEPLAGEKMIAFSVSRATTPV